MPQDVRRNVRPHACLARVARDLHPERLSAHRPSATREKQVRIGVFVECGTALFCVFDDDIARGIAERNDAFLRAFADRAQKSGVEHHLVDAHLDQLAHPQTRRVQQLEHRGVT
jgi:hypothetical protein